MERKKVNVIFFQNGNTSVFENGEQVPELQKSWFLNFIEFLEDNNVDIINSSFEIPMSGTVILRKLKLTKTEDGYNWNVEK